MLGARTVKRMDTFTILSVLLILVLGRGMSPFGAASAVTTSTSLAAEHCMPAASQAYDNMNQATAVTNAQDSAPYSQVTSAYLNATFLSIFEIGKTTVPYPTCTYQVSTFNVVFGLYSSSGKLANELIVTEDSSLNVLGEQIEPITYANTANYYWSGYQTEANSEGSAEVYIAESDYTQPHLSSSTPSTGCGELDKCSSSTWVGLQDDLGHLAQAGTEADCSASGTSCSNSYFAWYEIVDREGQIPCNSTTGNPLVTYGDSMYALTENEAYYSGNPNTYEMYVYDGRTDDSCFAAQKDNSMDQPTEGEFIEENTEECNGFECAPLANFTSASFSSATIETLTSSGTIDNWYPEAFNMQNEAGSGDDCTPPAVTDVSTGSVSSGDFTATYESSEYTPFFSTGC